MGCIMTLALKNCGLDKWILCLISHLSITGMVNSTSVIVPGVSSDVRGRLCTFQRTGSTISQRRLRFHEERKCRNTIPLAVTLSPIWCGMDRSVILDYFNRYIYTFTRGRFEFNFYQLMTSSFLSWCHSQFRMWLLSWHRKGAWSTCVHCTEHWCNPRVVETLR